VTEKGWFIFLGTVTCYSSAMAKKGAGSGPITLLPDIPYKKAEATFRLSKENEMDIGENLMIMSIQQAAWPNCGELIVGDRITKVNGQTVKNKAECVAAIRSALGSDIKVEVLRRQFTKPLTPDRAKKIGLTRLEGFTYFLLTCTKVCFCYYIGGDLFCTSFIST
ncbi:hypothetical protein GCK32_005225, partial [Trichostrongylus colubriformis]